MNFQNLRALFNLNFVFDVPFMIKSGLIKIDLNTLVLFYELGSSIRLEDLMHVRDIKCLGNNVVSVHMRYDNKVFNSIAFSSREEALQYIEVLTFFINLLPLTKKS